MYSPIPTLKKKLAKRWRLRNFTLFGKRILRQERTLPLDIRNIRKVALYVRQMDRIKDLEGAVVECGVWKGRSLFILASLALQRKVWGFDTFAGFPSLSEHDIKEVAEKENFRDTSKEMVGRFLSMNKVSVELVEGPFEKTLPEWKARIGPIAFLHIDCDIYDSYKTCLSELFDQVVPGGVMVFDEYKNPEELKKWPGAARAIDEFCASRGLTVIDGGGKGIVIKP
ncbi:MAG: TylF/MycF/NovP-related O-methyltransferase [Patescibacteria group bacterium]